MFIGLEDGLEGLLHISEMSEGEVENPETLVKVGDEIEVKVLRVDTDDRKIGLSLKRVDWTDEQEAAAQAEEEVAVAPPVTSKVALVEMTHYFRFLQRVKKLLKKPVMRSRIK